MNRNQLISESAQELAYEQGRDYGYSAREDIDALKAVAVSLVRSTVPGYAAMVAQSIEDAYQEGRDLYETESYDDCPLDGDHDSAMTSIGWGTDEDYGYYGDDGGYGDW